MTRRVFLSLFLLLFLLPSFAYAQWDTATGWDGELGDMNKDIYDQDDNGIVDEVEADHPWTPPHIDSDGNVGLGSEILAGDDNVGIGSGVFPSIESGAQNNVGIGFSVGIGLTTGDSNFLLGSYAGYELTTGGQNVGIGTDALAAYSVNPSTSSLNVGIGNGSLSALESGNDNVGIGEGSLQELKDGDSNVGLGRSAGLLNEGDFNVFLGHDAGATQTTVSNQLWIDSSNTTTPLIHGDFSADTVTINGKLTVTPFTRHVQLPAETVGKLTDQPTPETFGTAACLQFASLGTSEYAYATFEVGEDWVGGEDIIFEIDWFPAMTGTETVTWDVTYRSILEGETITNGTAVTVSVTDSGDYSQYVIEHSPFTLDYDNGNQPLVHEDHVFLQVTRDTGVANDFAGTVCVTAFEIIYNANTFAETN